MWPQLPVPEWWHPSKDICTLWFTTGPRHCHLEEVTFYLCIFVVWGLQHTSSHRNKDGKCAPNIFKVVFPQTLMHIFIYYLKTEAWICALRKAISQCCGPGGYDFGILTNEMDSWPSLSPGPTSPLSSPQRPTPRRGGQGAPGTFAAFLT